MIKKLSTLKPKPGSVTKKKIIGRGYGSKRGSTSGKGNNGNKQRSGYKTKWGFEGGQTPFYKRMPIIKHINNFADKKKTITLDMLVRANKDKDKNITADFLEELKLIRKGERYKIVCGREDKYDFKGIEIRADGFSTTAKRVIEETGGSALLNKEIKTKGKK